MMMCYNRVSDNPYKIEIGCTDISKVANAEKKIPGEFISPEGNDVTEAFVNYVRPLIIGEPDIKYQDGLPVHIAR